MSPAPRAPRPTRRNLLFGTAAASAGVLVTGCTSNKNNSDNESGGQTQAAVADDQPGRHVTIGFAGPQADHGWLNAINESAHNRAEEYEDVTLKTTEGSNDTAQQIGQIETLINSEVDVLVVLPAG